MSEERLPGNGWDYPPGVNDVPDDSAGITDDEREIAELRYAIKALKSQNMRLYDLLKYTQNRLADNALAEEVAAKCNDPYHDPRCCVTCEARADGIDDYRRALAAPPNSGQNGEQNERKD